MELFVLAIVYAAVAAGAIGLAVTMILVVRTLRERR